MSENSCFMRNLRFNNIEVENSTKFDQDIKINDYHLKVTDGNTSDIYKAQSGGNNIWDTDNSDISIKSYEDTSARDNSTDPIGTLALISSNDTLYFKTENAWIEIKSSNTFDKYVKIEKKEATCTIEFTNGIYTAISGKYIELINKLGDSIRFQEGSGTDTEYIFYFSKGNSDNDVITNLKTKIDNTSHFSATSSSLTISVTQTKGSNEIAYINLNNSTDIENNIILGKFIISQQLLKEGLVGHYTAESFNSYNDWADLSGNNNHMPSGSGNRITKLNYNSNSTASYNSSDGFSRNFNSDPTYSPYITSAVIGSSYNDNSPARGHGWYEFHTDIQNIMKDGNYTFIHLAKYHNEVRSEYQHKRKIFNDSNDGDWYSGFNGDGSDGAVGKVKHKKTGGNVEYDKSDVLDPESSRNNDRVRNNQNGISWTQYDNDNPGSKSHYWLLTVDQEDRVRFNATHDSSTESPDPMAGGVGLTGNLRINSGANGEEPNSHWMIAFMAFWNRKLSTEEIKEVENHIINTYGLTF